MHDPKFSAQSTIKSSWTEAGEDQEAYFIFQMPLDRVVRITQSDSPLPNSSLHEINVKRCIDGTDMCWARNISRKQV